MGLEAKEAAAVMHLFTFNHLADAFMHNLQLLLYGKYM